MISEQYFADIADHWGTNDSSNGSPLPGNVVGSLRKVMAADGTLTFERLCAGLKIAILRHDAEIKKRNKEIEVSNRFRKSMFIVQCLDFFQSSMDAQQGNLCRTSSMPNIANQNLGNVTNPSFGIGNLANPSPAPSEPVFALSQQQPEDVDAMMPRMSMGPPKPPRDFVRSSGNLSILHCK